MQLKIETPPVIAGYLSWNYCDRFLIAAFTLKLHYAIFQCEKGVVLSHADIDAGENTCALLSDDDGTGVNFFAAVGFDAQSLAVRVATVTR